MGLLDEITGGEGHQNPSVMRLPVGTGDRVLHRLAPPRNPFLDDAHGWVRIKTGEFLWSKQKEITESVQNHRFTAVRSAHGTGKSFLAARIVAWWIDTHELYSAFAVTTAPTWPQVNAILWRELRRVHRKAHLPGTITQDCEWKIGGELIAMGRKPADYDQSAFQGIHERFVLVVVDEGGGVPKTIYDAIDTLATNDDARVLVIGNPDDPGSHFKTICDSEDWNSIQIPAFITPNFTGEKVPDELRKQLVSPGWVEERKRLWGLKSALYQSKVLAEFPDTSDVVLIPPSYVQYAQFTNLPGLEPGQFALDVSRFGSAESALYRNRGGVIRLVETWAKQSTMVTADAVADILATYPFSLPIAVDVVGIGGGVLDRLQQLDFNAYGFSSSDSPNSDRFHNKRAESWWHFREGLASGKIDLDPEDTELAKQLSAPKYKVNGSGKIQLESKEEMQKRGVASPDRADAAVMAYYAPPLANIEAFIESMQAQFAEADLTHDLLERKM